MSQMASVRIAGIVAMLSLAAAPFAMGRELPGWLLSSATTGQPVAWTSASTLPASLPTSLALTTAVDRSAKSDRGVVAARSGQATRTVSIEPIGIDGTSVLLRIPERVREATDVPARHIKSPELSSKPRTACEPVVSVLTAVAKQLAPGRCVT